MVGTLLVAMSGVIPGHLTSSLVSAQPASLVSVAPVTSDSVIPADSVSLAEPTLLPVDTPDNGDANGAVSSQSGAVEDKSDALPVVQKTAMCLLNELVRFHKVWHQYQLIDDRGPAHQRQFTVTLSLHDEVYTATGGRIKLAQQAAAALALQHTKLKLPPVKHQQHSHQKTLHSRWKSIPPTVELNALAMKQREPVRYTVLSSHVSPLSYHLHYNQYANRMHISQYRVAVHVCGHEFTGVGITLQHAKHAAASNALHRLRTLLSTSLATEIGENGGDMETPSDSNKSSVSQVYELARCHCMCVVFQLSDMQGPAHMRRFVTHCRVGDNLAVTGEGCSKKMSKKDAADKMLVELKSMSSSQLNMSAKTKCSVIQLKRPSNNTKKRKAKNLVKLPPVNQSAPPLLHNSSEQMNPVSRLSQWRQIERRPPVNFTLVDIVADGRRKQFIMSASVSAPNSAVCTDSSVINTEDSCIQDEIITSTASGPSKKLAKRAVAEKLLVKLGFSRAAAPEAGKSLLVKNSTRHSSNSAGRHVTFQMDGDDGVQCCPIGRQLVPGVIVMSPSAVDTHCSNVDTENSCVESTALSSGGVDTVRADVQPRDKLLYLANVMKFQVQFTNIPRGNESTYLSLVSLSTNPPHMSHGEGVTPDAAQQNAALAALTAMSLTGHNDGDV